MEPGVERDLTEGELTVKEGLYVVQHVNDKSIKIESNMFCMKN